MRTKTLLLTIVLGLMLSVKTGTAGPAGPLTVQRDGDVALISWPESWPDAAILQSANEVTGPWADVEDAPTQGPVAITPVDKRKFFRLRCAGWCDGTNLITEPITLTAQQGEWSRRVTLKSGLYRIAITYGVGGIANEGYPGFPGGIYSPYPNGRGSASVRMRLDGREIAAVQVPPMPPEPGVLRQAVIPFICQTPGERETRLVASLYDNDQLEITQIVLEKTAAAPVPHTLQQPRPGWPLMDLISWCEYVYYTIPPGLGPDDILAKTLRPSWKAGLNMIWTVLNNASGTIPFPWDEQATGIWSMPSTYAWSNDGRWQVEGYRRYLGYVHERGMMEMLYWPGGLPGVRADLTAPGGVASAIKGFDKIYNSLRYDPRGLSDAISNERYCATNNSLTGSRPLALAHVNQLLESNPGAFAVNYISGVDSARPGMVGDFPNGLEPYSAGYFEGRDDALMFAPDPWLLRVAGGKKYRWIEFWTEDGELIPASQRDPKYTSWYGGHIGEDYIVKQMNDMARLRLLAPEQCDALTGVTWYTDGNIVSSANVEMAHAVSQDPVRAAMAGQLRTLGQGGRVRSLYPYAANSHFLQNNYLALFLPTGKTGGELFYDLKRTANFTPSSFCVPLSRNFLDVLQNETVTSTTNRVLERGGYRSVLQSTIQMSLGQTTVGETRTFEMIADTPYLTVTIEDQVQGPMTSLGHVLGGDGFDQLLVGGQVVQETQSLAVPKIAVLRDSSGLKPDLAVLFLETPAGSTLAWWPGQSLAVNRPQAQRLRLALAAPTDLYLQNQLEGLGQLLSQPMLTINWENGPMRVNNTSPLPVTQVVALRGADDRPYLVGEGGWWTFRGAQKSKQVVNTDFVKVYLASQGEATILPWGFIEGVARPGWGCQYVLALAEVGSALDGGSCRVKVLSETPMIFAPRVEFAWPIAEVELDGKPWFYFDDTQVFLPQSRGEHELRVRKGTAVVAHLTRTYLNVRSTRFSDGELSLETVAPPWRPKIPEGLRLTAQIEHPGRELAGITGGKNVKGTRGQSLISVEPGTIKIRFK